MRRLTGIGLDLLEGKWRWRALPVAFLLLVFLFISIASARHESLTYDEDLHFLYGMQILQLNSNRFNPSQMPVTALNALPKAISAHLPPSILTSILARFPTARMVTVMVSIGLAFLCFAWARQLNGYFPALLSLALYVLEPNIIAHSQLVTTDLYAAAACTFTLYALWRYALRGGWARGLAFGLILGLAQLAKFSCILLVPICVSVHAIYLSPSWIETAKSRHYSQLGRQVGGFLLQWLGFGLLTILVINAGFFFNRTLMPLYSMTFHSEQFQSLQKTLPQLSSLRVPLPQPYLIKLDQVVYAERTAKGGLSSFYLLGKLSHSGFLGYYLVAFLYKVPLAIQAIALISFVMVLRNGLGKRFLGRELFILVPLLIFMVYFNLLNRFPKGIRHYLVVFPFTLILCSTLATGWRAWTRWKWYALIGAYGYLVVSVLSYFPHYISYFNELVTDRRFAYRILADSNLDWGQNQWYLARYEEDHPEAHISPEQPVDGTVVVGVNEFLGILGSPDTYAWLRCCYQPVDTVAYSYLVFEVPPGSTGSAAPP
jgi:4-amino-4-deoxy-L-arabinose transferase-like glycosyltransferase